MATNMRHILLSRLLIFLTLQKTPQALLKVPAYISYYIHITYKWNFAFFLFFSAYRLYNTG